MDFEEQLAKMKSFANIEEHTRRLYKSFYVMGWEAARSRIIDLAEDLGRESKNFVDKPGGDMVSSPASNR